MLEQDISIDGYKILLCDRIRHGVVVACYVRKDLSYKILSVFRREIENIFLKLLVNLKPITVGTVYRLLSQSNFLEVLNNNVNEKDSVNNEIYILDDSIF